MAGHCEDGCFHLPCGAGFQHKGGGFEVMKLAFYTNVSCYLHICGTDICRCGNDLQKIGHNRVGVKRMGTDCFQWCPATGQKAMGTK